MAAGIKAIFGLLSSNNPRVSTKCTLYFAWDYVARWASTGSEIKRRSCHIRRVVVFVRRRGFYRQISPAGMLGFRQTPDVHVLARQRPESSFNASPALTHISDVRQRSGTALRIDPHIWRRTRETSALCRASGAVTYGFIYKLIRNLS